MQLCLPPGTISREKWRLTLRHKDNALTIARGTKPGGIALLFTPVAISSYPDELSPVVEMADGGPTEVKPI